MKNLNVTDYQRIRVEDIVISDVTEKLYDYTNRESEISFLMESISLIGQQQPITVISDGLKYVLIDGYLRYDAMIRLNLNEIDVIVCDDIINDTFTLPDLIIHHHLHKNKTNEEKLNEIIEILRIEQDINNPLRDKEERVSLVSYILGKKGWGRNNVFYLENILRWEMGSDLELNLSLDVINNTIPVKRALDAIKLISDPLFSQEKENESHIIAGFLKGAYSAEKAEDLMTTYDTKKSVGHTIVDLYPPEKRNYIIIQGNIEEVLLPSDLRIDTIFTSPPYYHLVKYGNDPNELGWEKTPSLYVKRLADILMKGFDKLKDTGSMFINLGESYENHSCLAITERLTIELIDRGVNFVDRIIWNKVSNKPVSNTVKRLLPGYETILHFSKTKDYNFEKFRIQSDKNLKVTRGCKERDDVKPSHYIPNNYDQFRNVMGSDEVNSVLTIQLSKNRTKHIKGESIHPATFSSNLPVIPLLISTPQSRDSVVFDPFLGSGSCGVTSLLLGYKFVGVELYEKNIQTSNRILSEVEKSFNEIEFNSFMDEIYTPGDQDVPVNLSNVA